MQRFEKGELFFEIEMSPGAFTVRRGGGASEAKEAKLSFRGPTALFEAYAAQIEGALSGGFAFVSAFERLERTEKKPEFLELRVDGKALETRTGAPGREASAKLKTKEFPTGEAARVAFNKELAKRVQQGWVSSAGAVLARPKSEILSLPRDPAIEQRIAGAIDDPAGYAAYAEWLEAKDDPRAALVRVGAERIAKPSDAALEASERELTSARGPRYERLIGGLVKSLLPPHHVVRRLRARAVDPCG